MGSRPTRVFNTSDKVFVTTYGAKEFVFQPKGGGHFIMVDQEFPDPRREDPDPDIAKKFKKAVLKKRVPVEDKKTRKMPDWLDVPSGFVDFMINGKIAAQLEDEGVVLKTLKDMGAEQDSLLSDNDKVIAQQQARIAELNAEIAALEAMKKPATKKA